MNETLRRVRGVVSSKDLVPALTHFCVSGGRIQGTNSRVTIDAACPELAAYEFAVPADRFVKAIDALKDAEPKITLKDGFINMSAGRVRIKLPTIGVDQYPLDTPSTECAVDLEVGDVVQALSRIEAFISQDASRPWSCSVYFHDGYAYATNNVVFVRTPCTWAHGEPFVLPVEAVKEVIRIGESPLRACTSGTHITFYYDNFWLRARLSGLQWPSIEQIVSVMEQEDLEPIPTGLLESVRTLIPFFPDAKVPVVKFSDTTISTMDGAQSAEVDCDGLSPGAFRVEALLSILPTASTWKLSNYPGPIPFVAKDLQGVFVGVRS